MKIFIVFFGAGITGLLLSGCSTVVAQGGKHMDRVLVAGASLQSIRDQLGLPTVQITYSPALVASEIPEIATLAKFRKDLALTNTLGSCEDYVYRGRVHDERDNMIVATMDKSTLGFGELLMFPCVAREAARESQHAHKYRVWYRPDGSYFTHVELLSSRVESK
jgi:uncharacterized protein YceK